MSTETFHHKLDFTGLSLEKAGTPEWERVRAQMMEVVANKQNWFEAVYDGVAPELREALFGRTMKELFALPRGREDAQHVEQAASRLHRPVPGLGLRGPVRLRRAPGRRHSELYRAHVARGKPELLVR